MNRLDIPFVRVGDVASAANIASSTLASWLDRGQIELAAFDKPTTGTGDYRLLSMRTVYRIAIVAQLSELRLPVRIASAIASHFSDAGNEGRGPGELFPTGPTYLTSSWPALAAASVCNFAPPPQARSSIVVDCRAVVAAVNGRLHQRGILTPNHSSLTTDASLAA